MYIAIFDIHNNLIEKKVFITFDTLKARLKIKLSTLALFFASKKEINNNYYFRYYKMIIYKLSSFNTFIELIKKDIIIVDIIGRVSRSGNDAGRQRNKNLVFKIPKDKLKYLFEPIYICNENLDSIFKLSKKLFILNSFLFVYHI